MNNQGSENKKIVKNTFYLYIRLLFSLFIGLYTSRVVLEVLGVEDYGLYTLVGGFVSMLTILTGTLNNTAVRFITFEIGTNNKTRLKRTVSSIVNIFIFASLLVFIIGGIIAFYLDYFINVPLERYNAALFVYFCSLFVFCMNLFSVPYQAIVMAHEHMNFFSIMSIGENVLKLLVILIIPYIRYDSLYYYAFTLALISLLSRLLYGIYCRYKFEEARYSFELDKELVIKMSGFSFWIGVGTFAGMMKDQGINLVINWFAGLALNAARGISVQVTNVFNMFSNNIGMALSPQITKSYSQGKIDRSIKLTFASSKAQGYMILGLMIPFILESHYILTIWLKSFPAYTQEFVCWSIIICFFQVLSNTLTPIYLAYGKVRNMQIFSTILCLCYFALSYLLCREGADILVTMYMGALVAIIIYISYIIYLRKTIQFPLQKYCKDVIFPMALIGLITTILINGLQSFFLNESFIRLIIIGIVSLFLFLILVFFVGLNSYERGYILPIIRNRLLKLKNKKSYVAEKDFCQVNAPE